MAFSILLLTESWSQVAFSSTKGHPARCQNGNMGIESARTEAYWKQADS